MLSCHGVLRQVVRVGDPTDLVRKLLVVAREVGGTPAVDRVADVLGGADDDGEDDKEENGVAVVKAVDKIIVVAHVHLRDFADGVDETAGVHGGVGRQGNIETNRHSIAATVAGRPPLRETTLQWLWPVADSRAYACVRAVMRYIHGTAAKFDSGGGVDGLAGGRH